ncbi:MAG: alpha/beta hydrolase [Salinibacterium sp.]|nr:alpha/beta hydrolase [Salinibacterium sp.]
MLLIVKDNAGKAGPDSPIYLASNYVGWNPGDPTMRLQGRSDLRWQIMLPQSDRDTRLAFKFTRGMWEKTECNPDFSPIDNRVLPMVDPSTVPADKPYIIEYEIPAWDDQSPEAAAELAATDPNARLDVAGGEIVKLEFAGGGGAMAGVARNLLIWLPPGYHDPANANREYPVLYLHDGQNLFAKHAGIPAEWGVDETLIDLVGSGAAQPCIVVGIPHAGESRASEYLMADVIDGVSPDADRYVRILADQIVPRVESAVRARRSRDARIVGGASLGGLISLYAAFERPEVFGKVLAESPSIRLRGQTLWTQALGKPSKWPTKVFLGGGGREAGDNADANKAYTSELRSLAGVLEANGVKTELLIQPEAEHNEAAWADRFDDAVRFLLGE